MNRQPRISRAQPIAARVSRATAASSHGSAWSAYRIVGSWPLPARSTTSPGRARSNAASIAARRSGIASTSTPRCRPALSAPRTISSTIAVGVLAARILVGRHDEPAALARDPAHLRRASRCRALRPSRTRRSARRRARRRPARAGRGRRRATPASGRSRRSPRTAGPGRSAPSGPGRPRRASRPARTAAASRPRPVAERDDGERVVDVEPAGEPELDRRPRPTAPT